MPRLDPLTEAEIAQYQEGLDDLISGTRALLDLQAADPAAPAAHDVLTETAMDYPPATVASVLAFALVRLARLPRAPQVPEGPSAAADVVASVLRDSWDPVTTPGAVVAALADWLRTQGPGPVWGLIADRLAGTGE